MAHSYVELNTATSRLRDSELEILIFMIAKEVRDEAPAGSWAARFAPAVERWTSQEVLGCSGCMDLRLQDVIAGVDDAQAFLDVLAKVEHRIDEFSGAIPAKYLNAISGYSGLNAFQSDLRPEGIVAALHELARVIKEGAQVWRT